jgi:hypothetical protein
MYYTKEDFDIAVADTVMTTVDTCVALIRAVEYNGPAAGREGFNTARYNAAIAVKAHFAPIGPLMQGDRVTVKQLDCYDDRKSGVIKYIEPLGSYWVLLDGASGDAYYHPGEIEHE